MTADQFISEPVFQLNLMIWMTIEQPPAMYRVRPLFYECGFELLYIEQPFKFPTEIHAKIAAAVKLTGVEIRTSPEPDVLLQSTQKGKALYLEAKRTAFKAESTSAAQARAHLVASGPAFGEVFAGLNDCLLVYVVTDSGCETMRQCLGDLAEHLRTLDLKPGPAGVNGLSSADEKVFYRIDPPTAAHLGTDPAIVPIMDGFTGETDPSPLLLVFSDEDCPNVENRNFYRRAVQNQVLARLLCILQHGAIGAEITVNARELLLRTTAGVFAYLGKQRQVALEKLVVQNVFMRIANYWSEGAPGRVKILLSKAIFLFLDHSQKEEFLDWLENPKKTNFDDTQPPAAQPELFDL